jgi:hypothetical protein
MKYKLCFILSAVFVMFGCTRATHFYPVQGPLSSQTPLPVLNGKFSTGVKSGNISVVMHDGDTCKGRWTIIRPSQSTKGSPTTSVQTTNGMHATWDAVYGSGYYVSHDLGTRLYAQSVIPCAHGDSVAVEIYESDGGGSGGASQSIHGVAKDSRENIYKLTVD